MAKKKKNKRLNNTGGINNINASGVSGGIESIESIANSTENPYKIGDIVLASAGRDADRLFVVVGILDKEYVLLADGRSRRADAPKKKKIRHIQPAAANTGVEVESEVETEVELETNAKTEIAGGFTNLTLKNIIAEYIKNSTKINNL